MEVELKKKMNGEEVKQQSKDEQEAEMLERAKRRE
jgi:hypothetical protein